MKRNWRDYKFSQPIPTFEYCDMIRVFDLPNVIDSMVEDLPKEILVQVTQYLVEQIAKEDNEE